MFIRKVTDKRSGCTRIQLCETFRENGKVKQKIIRHVGIARSPEEVERFARLAAGLVEREIAERNRTDPLFSASSDVEKNYPFSHGPTCDLRSLHEVARVVEGPKEVLEGIFDDSGFNSVFKKPQQTDLLKTLVLERIANPDSKLGTAESSEARLGEKIDVNRLYRLLDALERNESNVLKAAFASAASLYSDGIDLVCFDVTTLYFESTKTDELRAFGYSKDQKSHSVQVTLALATTREGIPVGYKLFSGNTAETKTLLTAIAQWKTLLPIQSVVFVADRGMFSLANLHAIVEAGHTFIVAAPLRKMGSKIGNFLFLEDDYRLMQIADDGETWWARTLQHQLEGKIKNSEGGFDKVSLPTTLLATWSRSRAQKDAADRERLIERMRSLLGNKSESGAKKLVSNSGYKKYASFQGKSIVDVDDQKVQRDSHWDGMHGILTNGDFSAREIIERYRHLLSIEDSFRIAKHDLKMRPIYHFAPRRIRAHVALCFISLCLVRRLQIQLRRKSVNLSATRIREALNSVQASVLKDAYKKKIRVPSKMTADAVAIYDALGLKRRHGVTHLNA
jgi:transposase